MTTNINKGKLKVNLYVILGNGWLGPIDFTIYDHHLPETITSSIMDDVLNLPDDMRTKTERKLFLLKEGRFIQNSFGKEGVKNYDTIALTDINDPQIIQASIESAMRIHHPIMPPLKNSKNNPWQSGLFYLINLIAIITLLAVISNMVPVYVFPIILIGGAIIIALVGILQLRNDDRIEDKTFSSLIVEVFKRLPLLKFSKTKRDNN